MYFFAFPSREEQFVRDGNTRLHFTYPKGRDLKWDLSYHMQSGLKKNQDNWSTQLEVEMLR